MGLQTGDIAGLALGGGLLCIGGWLLFDKYEQNKLINEYMDKVARCENEFRNAINRGDYEAAQTISDFYSSLMTEEEDVINKKGFFDKLVQALWAAGFVIAMWKVAPQIIKIINNRWGKPPGGFKCPECGRTFPTADALQEHLQKDHGWNFNPDAVSAAEKAFQSLSGWVKDLVSLISGVESYILSKPWESLPQWELIVIAIAALTLAAALWWLWFAGVPQALGTIGAMAIVAA
jgi:uncharacterized C2H2 Zn-finger protein